MPGVSGVTVAHYAQISAAGASAPGIPAPSDWRGRNIESKPSGATRCEAYCRVWSQQVSKRHCERSEAIQLSFPVCRRNGLLRRIRLRPKAGFGGQERSSQ
jgi:hypothetical protein